MRVRRCAREVSFHPRRQVCRRVRSGEAARRDAVTVRVRIVLRDADARLLAHFGDEEPFVVTEEEQ